ncbi:MAG: mechanosensitive ion channel [Tepidisphaera sp.]|nr:mechanosensitive ion channel [Tepidisphaera sp.]
MVVVLALQPLVVGHLRKLTGKTKSHVDDVLVDALGDLRSWFFLMVGVYFFSHLLVLSGAANGAISKLLVAAIAAQALVTSRFFIEFGTKALLASRRGPDGQPDQTVQSASGVIRVLSTVVVGSVIVVFALSNMNVDVTSLIAGLGVGGIAVALAAQSILADTFGSLTILFDKPFLVGDFIVVGDKMGTVEHIGIKTTRVRALSGEQLVFANSDLLASRIQNYKRMQERRVVFGFGIIYETPLEKLKQVPDMVREVVKSQQSVRLDRVHFKSYGAYSLDFEVVYYVLNSDYNKYMDIQQAINLGMFDAFAKEGIEFAYPTSVEIYKPHGAPEQRSGDANGEKKAG